MKYEDSSKIIFISSDAVFEDQLSFSEEKDPLNPLNIYGLSKKKGEVYLEKSKNKHLTIRTTIIGKNLNLSKTSFLEWIIHSLRNNIKINLFEDVFFTPISIWSLSEEIKWILKNNISGTFHISAKNKISKYKFGLDSCTALGLNKNLIKRTTLEEFSFHAFRSKNQTLDSSRYERQTGRKLPSLDFLISEVLHHFNR